MRIVIPGGSGQVGSLLARAFAGEGHEVVVLSRGKVSHLAGRSVNCRYTRENLDEMMSSRVDSTRVVGQAIARAKRPHYWEFSVRIAKAWDAEQAAAETPKTRKVALRTAMAGMPIGLPATKWMLTLGAVFMRTDTELVLKSRRVVPGVLLGAGFKFDYPGGARPPGVFALSTEGVREEATQA